MNIYTHITDHVGHRIALIAATKNIEYTLRTPSQIDDEVRTLNPDLLFPCIRNKETLLAGQGVLMEYLEERFPHPPLYPLIPMDRGHARWSILVIQNKLGRYLDIFFAEKNKDKKELAQKAILSGMIMVESLLDTTLMNQNELSIVDCTLLPILWRLRMLDIPFHAKRMRLREYTDSLLEHPAFLQTLAACDNPNSFSFSDHDYAKDRL